MKLKETKGLLVQNDLNIQRINEVFGEDYDGFIVDNVTGINHVLGFYGLPLDETEVYEVGTL